jgi:hypothetical protein
MGRIKMRYLVRLGTAKEIERSEFNSDEIFIKNAKSAGFKEDEVEILTEEEYQARKELEPISPRLPTTEERLQMAEDTILFLLMGGM